MNDAGKPLLGRLFFRGYRTLEGLTEALSGVYTGLALGILSQRDLHLISERKYKGEKFYRSEAYNKRGLWDWERRAVEKHFAGCKSLLVLAAGGGREVLALRKRGMTVDGFESDPALVRFANELIEKESAGSGIELSPWDHAPAGDRRYDGVIVGWGAYMHIRGRKTRVALLRELRDKLETGSPVLLSFYTRMGLRRYFPAVARVGNLAARLFGGDRVEVGDSLIPNFVHFFIRAEMESEFREGGFEMVEFIEEEYGHSVGRAV